MVDTKTFQRCKVIGHLLNLFSFLVILLFFTYLKLSLATAIHNFKGAILPKWPKMCELYIEASY